MRYLVLGAGMMGRAAAYDLATTGNGDEVVLADVDGARAALVAQAIGPHVTPQQLDVNNGPALRKALQGCAAMISAVSYTVNEQLTKTAIEAGVHMCDLGGNNGVVDRQLAMDADAKVRGITVLPNCGLAPGLINILGVGGMKAFDSVDSIALRVGGLPQHPQPPLNYQIVFSVEGLINEYIEKAEVLRDGKRTLVDSMADLEEIEFPPPFGMLEAFTTSGGLSTLTRELEGKVRTLNYKTIRYKGHCEKFKTLLDLGFASAEPVVSGSSVRTMREFFTDLLSRKLHYGDTDLILARATITGYQGARGQQLAYEFIDYYDESTGLSAMMRTTAFPTSITARMLAEKRIVAPGVMPPEACVPADAMIEELKRRNIRITTTVTECTP
jgi:lysine 6-dehydrogenase